MTVKYLIKRVILLILFIFSLHSLSTAQNGFRSDTTVFVTYGDTLSIPSYRDFILPVYIQTGYEVSAITLGFTYPSDLLEVDSVILTHGINSYYYNISDSLVRIVWSSIEPVSYSNGDTLLTLILRSKDLSDLNGTIRLGISDFSEFADQSASVIDPIILSFSEIQFPRPDPGDSIAGSYVKVYPNPFSENVIVDFSVKSDSRVRISIYNDCGIEIQRLDEKEYATGSYQVKLYDLDFAQGICLLKFEIRNSEGEGSKLFKLVSTY